MADLSPLSPEGRRVHPERAREKHPDGASTLADPSLTARARTVAERIGVGVYTDGFTFAGNFAYLALLAVFAFFIVATAIAGSVGNTQAGGQFVDQFLRTLPPSVARALREPVGEAIVARTGPLLWLSAVVGLWTTGSLIETIREILHRAYGVAAQRAFWEYRLGSIGLIIVSVVLAMLSLSAQLLVSAIQQFIELFIPGGAAAELWLSLSRALPFVILFATLYALFRTLTPRSYRSQRHPKWPGAVFVSLWWLAITALLPVFLTYAANFELTYGSLAGIMITLIFFYLVGLGMVIGAQLNAALAEEGRGPLSPGGDSALENGDAAE